MHYYYFCKAVDTALLVYAMRKIKFTLHKL